MYEKLKYLWPPFIKKKNFQNLLRVPQHAQKPFLCLVHELIDTMYW